MLFRKNTPARLSGNDLRDIEKSIRLTREHLAGRHMPIEELFGLMGEDERPALSRLPSKKPEAGRVLPADIPNTEATDAGLVPYTFPPLPHTWSR